MLEEQTVSDVTRTGTRSSGAATPSAKRVLVLVAVLAVAACSSDGKGASSSGTITEPSVSPPADVTTPSPSASAPGTDAVSTSASPSPTSSDTSASRPDSTEADEVEALAGAIAVLTGGRMTLVPPEADCVEQAFADLPVRGRRAVEALIDDPIAGRSADRAAAQQVFAAYLGCLEPEALRFAVVLSFLKVLEHDCVADAWEGLLTADLVASSLTYGNGLDDLPADVVAGMAKAVAACRPDRQWWIEDVIFHDEIELDLTEPELECVAARYVDVMGIEEVVRRRLLNAPLLALPADQEARLDLPGHCNVTERGVLELFIADVGACAANVRDGTSVAVVTSCDRPHDGEVFAVHDLSSEHPSWPGVRAIVETANARCRADREAIIGDIGTHDSLTVHPLRRTWEQGDRAVLCVLVHGGDGVWNAPSGLVPAAATPATTTPPPPTTVPATTAPPTTAVPTGTTLPPGAREMFSLDEINRVGMCIYRPPALLGQADLDRRFFEVDCSLPHQAEMFHRFDLQGQPGAPYPGESATIAQADPVCKLTFAAYVGVPWESSRLDYAYFYPSVETWNQGDRSVVCFLVGSRMDEEFNRSMAGSRE